MIADTFSVSVSSSDGFDPDSDPISIPGNKAWSHSLVPHDPTANGLAIPKGNSNYL